MLRVFSTEVRADVGEYPNVGYLMHVWVVGSQHLQPCRVRVRERGRRLRHGQLGDREIQHSVRRQVHHATDRREPLRGCLNGELCLFNAFQHVVPAIVGDGPASGIRAIHDLDDGTDDLAIGSRNRGRARSLASNSTEVSLTSPGSTGIKVALAIRLARATDVQPVVRSVAKTVRLRVGPTMTDGA